MNTQALKDVYRFNSTGSRKIELTAGGLPMDLTGAVITSQFRKKEITGRLVKELSIGNGITVTDPASGVVIIDEFYVDFEADIYHNDIRVEFSIIKSRNYMPVTMRVLNTTTTPSTP